MMTKIYRTGQGRVQNDPRINMLGERVDRVWADPILTPRRGMER